MIRVKHLETLSNPLVRLAHLALDFIVHQFKFESNKELSHIENVSNINSENHFMLFQFFLENAELYKKL